MYVRLCCVSRATCPISHTSAARAHTFDNAHVTLIHVYGIGSASHFIQRRRRVTWCARTGLIDSPAPPPWMPDPQEKDYISDGERNMRVQLYVSCMVHETAILVSSAAAVSGVARHRVCGVTV